MKPLKISLTPAALIALPMALALVPILLPAVAAAQPDFSDVSVASGTADPGLGQSVAWGDYDNDGDLDCYVANINGANRLYRNNGNGTFTDVSAASGTAGSGTLMLNHSSGAVWGDYDNDGDLDLFVGNSGPANDKLYRNNGNGTFADVSAASGTDGPGFVESSSRGLAWGDYDNDGYLDLYVTDYYAANRLYRNNGNGTFTDVSAASGTAGPGTDQGAAWGDYDNDGDLDLYLANYGQANKLYRNNGNGTFADVSAASGTADAGTGNAAAWGDYDNDGDLDLYLANRQNASKLYRNNGNGTFTDVSASSGTAAAHSSNTPTWGDYDNDGDLDLYVARAIANSLYRNNGNGTFTDVGAASGTADTGSGDGVAWGDCDNDGDLDLYVANYDGANKLYRNDSSGGNHWLQVDLTGVKWNRGGIGAQIRVLAGGVSQTRTVSGGGYGSQNSLTAQFGLGAATVIDSLIVRWPLGLGVVQVVDPLPAVDSRLTVTKPPDFTDVSVTSGTGEYNAGGVAWGDFDNDGNLDLYAANFGPSRLYYNLGNGSFFEVGSILGVAATGPAVAWGDYDNDGNLDLYVATYNGANKLYRNRGDWVFADVSAASGTADTGSGRGVAWGDYDNDGDLDLYVANYGGANKLYRNRGDGTFADVSAASGTADTGWCSGVAWGDYDNDGDLDLYVANYEVGANRLYQNNGNGTFADVSAASGTDLHDNSFGVAWGDYDNDGDLDLYVAIYGGANRLYRNNGNGTFADVSAASGTADTGWGSSVAWGDYDNDGRLDLYLTNYFEANRLYRNRGDGTFADMSAASGTADTGIGLGAAWGDYDNDGDLDLYVATEPSKLYRNDRAPKGHWLHVNLAGTVSNRSGVGARVRVVTGGTAQTQEISGGSGYGSQNSLTAEFGLGAATSIDSLVVRWPSGHVQVVSPPPAVDQRVTVIEVADEPPFEDVSAASGTEDEGFSLGVAWGDYDSDGDLDLYVVNHGANKLYRNNGNMTYTDVSATSGTDDPGSGIGVVWGDYDNDGNLDLYVTNSGQPNKLYRNESGETFADVSATSGTDDPGNGEGAVWGDYDNDGNLDLYVTNTGQPNKLYRNIGNGTFADVAEASGTDYTGYGSGVAWGDYDNDGSLDLYVTNFDGANKLYRNNGDGTFADLSAASGTDDAGDGSGVAWGDYDNDGDLDLYVTNFDGANKLYRNNGDGTFADVSAASGTAGTWSAVSVAWGDYDNDGDLDLYVTSFDGANKLYRNDGVFPFADVSAASGTDNAGSAFHRAAAWGDYDNDGDLDLFVAKNGANKFYRNVGASGKHWLQVALVGAESNASAIGARVRVVAGGTVRTQEISGGSGIGSQNSLEAEFGLGNVATIDSLVVRWPSGRVQAMIPPPAVDQRIVMEETLRLWISDPSKAEGNAGSAPLTFIVTLSNPTATLVTADWTTADGTATASDGDYVPASGTVEIPAGGTADTVTVQVNGDPKYETDETLLLTLSNAVGATVVYGPGVGTIKNDDALSRLSINDVRLREGNSGTTPFVFTVSLSNPSQQPVTVDWATSGGTATAADNDFVSASGTATIPANGTSATVTVAVTGDTRCEPDETFSVKLAKPVGATITRASGTGTIANDPDFIVAATQDLEDRITVSWCVVGREDVRFRIYRDGAPLAVASSASFGYDDLTAIQGRAYNYRVDCVTVAGDSLLAGSTVSGMRVLVAPGDVWASDGTFADGVAVTWVDRSAAESGYIIYRGNLPDTTTLAITGANVTFYRDLPTPSQPDLPVPGETYRYSVAAVGAQGSSYFSAARSDSGYRAVIMPVASLVASDGEYRDYVKLTWTDQSYDELGFRVRRDGVPLPPDLPPNARIFRDLDPAAQGSRHEYSVTAFKLAKSLALTPSSALRTQAAVLGNVESAAARDSGAWGPGTLAGPQDVTATDLGYEPYDDMVLVTWDDAPTENGYEITRDGAPLITLPANATRYEDREVDALSAHAYCVTAFTDSGGTSAAGNCDDGQRAGALAPANLTASQGTFEDLVELVWECPSTTVVLFKVYRDGQAIKTLPSAARSCVDYLVDADIPGGPSHRYTYMVTAVAVGGEESVDSNEAVGYRSLLAPTGVTASAGDFEDGVRLAWGDASSAEDGYRIYRWRDHPDSLALPMGTATLLDTLPANRTVYSDNRLASGVDSSYKYTVVAVDYWGDGEVARSAAGDMAAGYRELRAPTGAEASRGASEDRILVTWSDQSRKENGYCLYRSDTGTGGGAALIATLPPNATSYADVSGGGTPAFGRIYRYAITAFDGLSESAPDTATGYLNLSPPAAVGASDNYLDKVLVTWLDVSTREAGYAVYRNGSQVGNALPANTTRFDDTAAPVNKSLTYYVRALGEEGAMSDSAGDKGYRPSSVPYRIYSGVYASDGTYDDRIHLRWDNAWPDRDEIIIKRDGQEIARVPVGTHAYSDFTAEPGRTYEYWVQGYSATLGGETTPNSDFGRRPPNGHLTGRLATAEGAGLPGAAISLEPSPYRAVLLDGAGGYLRVDRDTMPTGPLTVEFWVRRTDQSRNECLFSYGAGGAPDLLTAEMRGSEVYLFANGSGPHAAAVRIADTGWHHMAVTWNPAAAGGPEARVLLDGALGPPVKVTAGASLPNRGVLLFGQQLLGNLTVDPAHVFAGLFDEIHVWSGARSMGKIQAGMHRRLGGDEPDLFGCWPLDQREGPAAADVTEHARYAELVGGAHWVGEPAPLEVSAVTDIDGSYAIEGIVYGTATPFRVRPGLGAREFNPSYKNITLSTAAPVQNGVDFTDVSSYTVTGLIAFEGTDCSPDGVEILVDGQAMGTTDASGNYAVAVTPGSHVIEPRLAGHGFIPESMSAEIEDDSDGWDFADTTRRNLALRVATGCGGPAGTVAIRIQSLNGCFDRTVMVSAESTLTLPPIEYLAWAEVVTDVPDVLDPVAVENFFMRLGSQEIDLTADHGAMDFVYRSLPQIRITGLPDVACETIGVPVLEQDAPDSLTIEILERYGDATCGAPSGTVTIYDEISDAYTEPVTLTVEDGYAWQTTAAGKSKYVVTPGVPNIFSGRTDEYGTPRAYQKSLVAVANVPGNPSRTATLWAVVTGAKAREGTITTMSTQEIPMLILRDPPGDGSYAFIERDSSITHKFTHGDLKSRRYDATAKIKIGGKLGGWLPKLTITAKGHRAEVWNEKDGVSTRFTFGERISTSSDELFVGRDGDIYAGLALDFRVAATDVVEVRDCQVVTEQSYAAAASGINTFYIFTEQHIRDVLLPQLDSLRVSAVRSGDSGEAERFQDAIDNWSHHLALNASQKASATPNAQRTFSAGADYSFTNVSKSDSTLSWSSSVEWGGSVGANLQWKYFEIGGSAGQNVRDSDDSTRTFSKTRTVGYVLSDNDAGDFFSVAVKDDPFYRTPVFDVYGGRSACPWEPWRNPETGAGNTQSRDSCLISVEPPLLPDVPANQPAVFKLRLTNASQSGETREYVLMPWQTSNPHGALIKANGEHFSDGLSFFIPPGAEQEVTLEVVRGPTRYNYDNLQVMLVPPCEYEIQSRAWAQRPLGKAVKATFSAHFTAPCSDITLSQPGTGWVATQSTLPITLRDFKIRVSETDSIQAVGVDYRRQDTEQWIRIKEIPRTNLRNLTQGQDLENLRVSLDWVIAAPGDSVPDGTYELRAYARCLAGTAYSNIASGRVDLHAPLALRTQPADGILSLGEEISVTFNEAIDCNTVNETTVQLEELLPVARTIASELVCDGTSIVIRPVDPPAEELENTELRVSINGVEDVAGNSGALDWTFIVRQGAFAWAQQQVQQDVGLNMTERFEVDLVNGTQSDVPFTLTTPTWLTAEPASGTVLEGEKLSIAFLVPDDLTEGQHLGTVTAVAAGQSPQDLQITLDVACRAPTWVPNASAFQYTMTMITELSDALTLEPLADPEDMVAAFVGSELRGVGHPQLLPNGKTLAFLTVYGRIPLEEVRFRLWDNDRCRLYSATKPLAVAFQADSLRGDMDSPFVLRGLAIPPTGDQSIALNEGWSWFSINRNREVMTTNAVLSSVLPAEGDLIKGPPPGTTGTSGIAYSEFVPENGWTGTLQELDVHNAYMLRLTEAATLVVDGGSAILDEDLRHIPLHPGWNWVGYVPNDPWPIGHALQGFLPAVGTPSLVKDQTQFALYDHVAETWVGTLAQMAPGLGYKFYTEVDATFDYPQGPPAAPSDALAVRDRRPGGDVARRGMLDTKPLTSDGVEPASAGGTTDWTFDPSGYEHTMTLTGELLHPDGRPMNGQEVIVALVNGETRGLGSPIYISGLEKYLLFLVVYSNGAPGELVTFQVASPDDEILMECAESVPFVTNGMNGSVKQPYALTMRPVTNLGPTLPTQFSLGNSFPNPFLAAQGGTRIQYALPTPQHVLLRVFDVAGRVVSTLVDKQQPAGHYEIVYRAPGLRSGVYFYRLEAGSFTQVRRMVVLQ